MKVIVGFRAGWGAVCYTEVSVNQVVVPEIWIEIIGLLGDACFAGLFVVVGGCHS